MQSKQKYLPVRKHTWTPLCRDAACRVSPARRRSARGSAEQRGEKFAKFSEESARRRALPRRGFLTSRLRRAVRGWRKRSGQSWRCPRTRIKRQRTRIRNRRRRRAGRVEHKRRLYLHVQFVGRNRGV